MKEQRGQKPTQDIHLLTKLTVYENKIIWKRLKCHKTLNYLYKAKQGLRINEGTGLLEICLPDLEQ